MKSINEHLNLPVGNAVEVWYCTPEFMREAYFNNFGDFDPSNMKKTHSLLFSFMDAEGTDDREAILGMLSRMMQDWHDGEFNPTLERLGIQHTSLSPGDMVRFAKDGAIYVAKCYGWYQIG